MKIPMCMFFHVLLHKVTKKWKGSNQKPNPRVYIIYICKNIYIYTYVHEYEGLHARIYRCRSPRALIVEKLATLRPQMLKPNLYNLKAPNPVNHGTALHEQRAGRTGHLRVSSIAKTCFEGFLVQSFKYVRSSCWAGAGASFRM